MDMRFNQDDEIGLVLETLRALVTKVGRPVIRACLEDAHDDIAHLSEHDHDLAGDIWSADAA